MLAWRNVALFLLLVGGGRLAQGYSVLSHEAIIDAAWDDIRDVLVSKFPAASAEDLERAHSYAYGGCVIQDMGYYPMASHFFTDLVHYVRSADFIEALLRDAQDLDELAFALGALAHYAADNSGHPIAVNRAVAIGYPKLRARYGDSVIFAQDPSAHLKIEFGFDVAEVAQASDAVEDYHDLIGFRVSKDLLAKAFLQTYGLELKDQLRSLDTALGTYRWTASKVIPEATRVAWALKKDAIVKARPSMTRQKFLYNLSRASYEKEWGKDYERPGIFAGFMAFLFRIVPKVGPFKVLSFKAPSQQTEAMFMQSFNRTLDLYQTHLREATTGDVRLANTDFDTGRLTGPGEYGLADETYAGLLRSLAKHNFKDVTPDLRTALLKFYQDPRPPVEDSHKRRKMDDQAWHQTMSALDQLKALNVPSSDSSPADNTSLEPANTRSPAFTGVQTQVR